MAQVTVKGRLISGDKKLFEGETDQFGNHNFSATIVLDDDSVAKIEAAKEAALEETFEGKVPKKLDDWVLREGDDEEYEASYGNVFVNAKSKDKKHPPVVKKVAGKNEPIYLEDGMIYAGCYVAAMLNVYAYKGNPKNKVNPGVTVGLDAVMFLRDGDRLGRPAANLDQGFEGFESEFDEEFEDLM